MNHLFYLRPDAVFILKKIFTELIKKEHPDFHNNSVESNTRTRHIIDAYKFIMFDVVSHGPNSYANASGAGMSGGGEFASAYSALNPNHEFLAIDLSQSRVFETMSKGVKAKRMDVTFLDLEEGFFDVVIINNPSPLPVDISSTYGTAFGAEKIMLLDSKENWDNYLAQIVKEAHKVSKPGGQIRILTDFDTYDELTLRAILAEDKGYSGLKIMPLPDDYPYFGKLLKKDTTVLAVAHTISKAINAAGGEELVWAVGGIETSVVEITKPLKTSRETTTNN